MPDRRFSPEEKTELLALKGVGPTVVLRLEQLGIHSFAQLANTEAEALGLEVSALLGSSCWRNSPQARHALQACIERARLVACSQD